METMLYSSKANDTDRMLLQDNYRATQQLNHRVVLASFSAGKTTNRFFDINYNQENALQLLQNLSNHKLDSHLAFN